LERTVNWKIVGIYAVALVVATNLFGGLLSIIGAATGYPPWIGIVLGLGNLLVVAVVCFTLARRHPELAWRHAAAALAAFVLVDYAVIVPVILSQGLPLLASLAAGAPRLLWVLAAMAIGVAIGRRFPAATPSVQR
jgi:hypothetical protein